MNYDLKIASEDSSQKMFNVLMCDTEIPIHRHTDTSETVVRVMMVSISFPTESAFAVEQTDKLLLPRQWSSAVALSKRNYMMPKGIRRLNLFFVPAETVLRSRCLKGR